MDPHMTEANLPVRNESPKADSAIIEFLEIIKVLHRRVWWVVLPVILLTSLAVAYISLATTKYTASMRLLVEGDSGPVIDLNKQETPVVEVNSLVFDQIQVLNSRDLAQRVVETLDLERDPEFNEELSPKSCSLSSRLHCRVWLVRLAIGRFARVLNSLIQGDDQDAISEDQKKLIKREEIISAFLKGMSVERVEKSRAIDVSFTSESSLTAWRVANALGDAYLSWRTNESFEHARKAGSWLEERTQKLRERAEKAERAVQEYRERNGLLEGERVTLIAEQISRLNAGVVDASINRKNAEADLVQVKRLLASSSDITSASQVMQSDVYKTLREEVLALEREEAELGKEFGPMHPQLQQLRAKKARLWRDMNDEVRKVVQSLENQAAAARGREQLLDGNLRDLKAQLASANYKSAELNALEREAEASRVLLERVVTGSMEKAAEQDPGAQSPAARILSIATIPIEPSWPPKLLLLVLTLFGSAVLGVLLALAVDMMDATYRTAEQIERALRVPVLSYIPAMSKAGTGEDFASLALRNPSSAFAEAVRTILTRLLLTNLGRPAKIIAVVSSEPEEGKSTLALAIAKLESRVGRKVLLIDADIRRSRTAQVLRVRSEPGLLDILSGSVRPEQAIQAEPQSGLHVIVSGDYKKHVNYSDFVVSDASPLRELLYQLGDDYDAIFVDTPPMLALVEANILATVADTSILIVAWGKTMRKTVDATVKIMRSSGAGIGGVILNLVDPRKLEGYYAEEAAYCTGRYQRYYDLAGEAGFAAASWKAITSASLPLGWKRRLAAAVQKLAGMRRAIGPRSMEGVAKNLGRHFHVAVGSRGGTGSKSLSMMLAAVLITTTASLLLALFLSRGPQSPTEASDAASALNEASESTEQTPADRPNALAEMRASRTGVEAAPPSGGAAQNTVPPTVVVGIPGYAGRHASAAPSDAPETMRGELERVGRPLPHPMARPASVRSSVHAPARQRR
jgi:polysaccharide biosynthesis transport protein